MKEKVNLLPHLQNLLDGCYDPKGGYEDEVVTDKETGEKTKTGQQLFVPWSKDHQPGGEISLNAQAREAFDNLCKNVGYKPDTMTELGGGGAMVKVKDLAAALAKTSKESVAEVTIDV